MSIAKLFSRRFLASALAVQAVAGGLVLLTPGAAEAATCGQSWSNKDPGSGVGVTKQGVYTFPLHNGIYGDCTVTSNVSAGVKLNYDCYRMNSAGNTWTHVRLASDPSVSGWAWDNYLSHGGSGYAC